MSHSISGYAEDEVPPTGDLTAADLGAARDALRSFIAEHSGRVERVGRFEVAVVG